MKFREFVGEKKVDEVKKIVQTDIGPTEKDFLEQVAKDPPKNPTYLAYSLNKKVLKRLFDYMRSWLIRYNVSFESVNPYLTVYLLGDLPRTSKFIKSIKTVRNVAYKPFGTITVISSDFSENIIKPKPDKDQIILNYIPNIKHQEKLENVFNSMDVKIIKKFCHVKLFEVEKGVLNHKFYENMMYSCPRIPYVNLGYIGLRRW